MSRTLITLDAEAKAWLAQQAVRERVSMSEIVRRAVDRLRAEEERRRALEAGVARTRGIWRHGDGLAWQNQLRGEWDER
ncbi:MAG: hypothetical protein LDL19_02375 [Thiobacillus sp.]|nr:hypothetical protein [Thiobacillus sp.]